MVSYFSNSGFGGSLLFFWGDFWVKNDLLLIDNFVGVKLCIVLFEFVFGVFKEWVLEED